MIQIFECDENWLTGITLQFGIESLSPIVTSMRFASWHHRLSVEIRAVDDAECVREASIPIGLIPDRENYHLYFDVVPDSAGRVFEIHLSVTGFSTERTISFPLSSGADRIRGHVVCLSSEGASIEAGLIGRLITSNPDSAAECPEGLLYSPLSSCNLNCIQCISKHSRKRVVQLDTNIKDVIASKVRRGDIRWMFTDYSGDILFADEKNPGELDYVLGLGIAVHIDTNGVYLNRKNIDKIIQSQVDAVSISVDAATDPTYSKIRIGSPPVDTIFAAAKMLVEARTAYGRSGNFAISMGFTLMLSNIRELPLFIRKAAEAGVDAVSTRHLEIYSAAMDHETLYDHKEIFNEIREQSLQVAADCGIKLHIGGSLTAAGRGGGNSPCDIPWTSLTILANGDVQACCSPGSRMGNLHETPLEQIWTGLPYRELRRRVNTSNPPSLCRNCQFRNTLNHFSDRETLRSHRTALPLYEELGSFA
jgi:radical SAM protein with 4Fe4S-binding SPASM domain